jgi:tRNA dimethylallyltransferase
MATTPLVVVVGPTASGKTTTAIEIAKKHNGEVICADSRTIYIGMDIATAKPTKKEMQGVVHWGLDLVTPDEQFSVADFKDYASKKIADIRRRGKLPILVGGTGLYIDSVIFDYQFGSPVDMQKREQLEIMTIDDLYEYCNKNNILLPENSKNKRYVIRAIETADQTKKRRLTPLENTIIVGITTDKLILRQKIDDRIHNMFDAGVVEETQHLVQQYDWKSQAMTSNIYSIVHKYLDGELTLQQAHDSASTADWRLAKRQLTWLKRNSFVHWLPLKEVNTYITDALANSHEA